MLNVLKNIFGNSNSSPNNIKSNEFRKIACILDEFSYQCFKYECNLIDITPDNWKEIVMKEKPEILLVESYWSGNNGIWKNTKIEHLNQLILLVKFCKSINIPTVFWNKEDPYSFNTFLNIARHFDIVYTTDIDCINKYKDILGHNNVYLLLFAAQTHIHNPIEIYDNRLNKISFAGTYYAKKFPERQIDFELIADVAINYGLDIYDRYFGENNEKVAFPKKYDEYIIGNLKGEEIIKAYKGYKYAVNLNSIKNSYTMFARRVLELMACNTLVISSYSKGMVELLGDLTIHDEDSYNLNNSIKEIMNDEITYKKYKLLALRKVIHNHTYKDRLMEIEEKALNIPKKNKWHSVAIVGIGKNEEDIKSIKKQFEIQNYNDKKLYIFSFIEKDRNNENTIYYIGDVDSERVLNIIKEEYISFFHMDDFYGPNYLTDLMCGTMYGVTCDAIGKYTYYSINPKISLIKKDYGEYRFVEKLMYRNSIIKTSKMNNYKIRQFLKVIENNIIEKDKMLSIDCFNYLHNGNINGSKLDKEIVLDAININIGKEIYEIENKYFLENNTNTYINIYELNLDKFISLDNDTMLLNYIDEELKIKSKLIKRQHTYIYYNISSNNFEKVPNYTPINIKFENEYIITSFANSKTVNHISICIIEYSKYKKENVRHFPINSVVTLSFDKNIDKIIIAIRIKGPGEINFEKIIIKERLKSFSGVHKKSVIFL